MDQKAQQQVALITATGWPDTSTRACAGKMVPEPPCGQTELAPTCNRGPGMRGSCQVTVKAWLFMSILGPIMVNLAPRPFCI